MSSIVSIGPLNDVANRDTLFTATSVCGELTRLQINNSLINDADLLTFLAKCSSLEHLDVSDCFCLTHVSFENILKMCPCLHTLNMYGSIIRPREDNEFLSHYPNTPEHYTSGYQKILEIAGKHANRETSLNIVCTTECFPPEIVGSPFKKGNIQFFFS